MSVTNKAFELPFCFSCEHWFRKLAEIATWHSNVADCDSSLSQHYPDLPVLASLLAGLLLPIHDSDTESHDVTASSQTSTPTSRACGPAWTPNHLLPITHGLRVGASVSEICERLQELDEISKRHVDILEHFVVLLHILTIISTNAESIWKVKNFISGAIH